MSGAKKLVRPLAAIAALVALLFAFAVPQTARGHMGEEKFRIERKVSKPPAGPRGQAEVHAVGGGTMVHLVRGEGADYTGAFEVVNTGPGPLTVNRVFVAGAEDDPRSAPGVSAIGDGNARGPIPPGGSRRYTVTWRSDQAKALQLSAAIVVDSDAAQPDAKVVDPPKLVGIEANRRLGLARYAVTTLFFVPLLLPLLALAGRALRKLEPRVVGWAAAAVALFQGAFATWAFVAFDATFGKRDGNEGLQFVEHTILSKSSSLEYYVGLDGWSISLVAIVALFTLIAVFVLDASRPGYLRELAATGLVASGATLTLAAQTMPLFTTGLAVAGFAGALLLWGSDSRERAAARQLAFAALVSTVLLALATSFIGKTAGATYLVDGSDAARTFGFADIARSKLVQHVEPIFGLPGYRALWLLTFAGLAPLLPFAPVHGWLRDAALTRSKRAFVPAALVPALGAYGILRLAVAMQPDGARWGAESLPWIGAITLVLGAVFALAEPDIRAAGAHLVLARAGFFLLSTFALTPEGISAAFGIAVTQPIAIALFMLAASTVVSRVEERRASLLSGIARSAPILATCLVLGALALGAPLLPGTWGALVGLVGSFGRNPVLTLVASAGLLVAAIGAARIARTAFGVQPASWRTSKYLEPFGGAPPDVRGRDLAWAIPLLAGAVALGFLPRAFVGEGEQGIRDLVPRLDPPGPTQVASAVDVTLPSSRARPSSTAG